MSLTGIAISLTSSLVDLPIAPRIIDAFTPAGTWTAALFHDISEERTPLTEGLGVTYSPAAFDRWLDLCSERYRFVSLDEVEVVGRRPARPLLLTFDDAYASVARVAAPRLAERGIPSVFFVNAAWLDNRELALDNLVAAVVNLIGMASIERVVGRRLASVGDVISSHVAQLDLTARQRFREQLIAISGLDPSDLLATHRPYVSSAELLTLPGSGMEIGNHTSTHVFCRGLGPEALAEEIVENQGALTAAVGEPVRAFAFPYGREADATEESLAMLRSSGHSAVFLVGGRLNGINEGSSDIRYRISVSARSASEAIAELEVLPLLRSLRQRLSEVGW